MEPIILYSQLFTPRRCALSFFLLIILGIAIFFLPKGELFSDESDFRARSLYNSLPKDGLTELLAFALLYPNTAEAVSAYQEAWKLISPCKTCTNEQLIQIASAAPDLICITRSLPGVRDPRSSSSLKVIESAAGTLGNRKLKGYRATDLDVVKQLPSHEIDLGRALLLSELEEDPSHEILIRDYEAALDWMALHIRASFLPFYTDKEKLDSITAFLFQTLHYRFPAYRKYSKHVEEYSLLGKVIDAQQGVCLGVSLLYFCLAQRLEIPLVLITPPGHIFLRYERNGYKVNIETTAGGIHIDDENYLGMELDELPIRTIKEAIGLAHINSGSMHWQNEAYDEAIRHYFKASAFMADDPLLMNLTGFCYYLKGDQQKGEELLMKAASRKNMLPSQVRMIAEDLLTARADAEALKIVYHEAEKERSKQEIYLKAVEKVMERCPAFRMGWMQLAMTWMGLDRNDHAIEALDHYHALDGSDPTVEYLLAELSYSRQDYRKAWNHLLKTEELCKNRLGKLKLLRELRTALSSVCAEERDAG